MRLDQVTTQQGARRAPLLVQEGKVHTATVSDPFNFVAVVEGSNGDYEVRIDQQTGDWDCGCAWGKHKAERERKCGERALMCAHVAALYLTLPVTWEPLVRKMRVQKQRPVVVVCANEEEQEYRSWSDFYGGRNGG